MEDEIAETEKYRAKLESTLRMLISGIGEMNIGKPGQFPFGWRKAAKGRTVWRLLEELISQNLENRSEELGLLEMTPADSEVGVYDFSFRFDSSPKLYVNIKSAVKGGKVSKDDISKADKLIAFYEATHRLTLFIATIEIQFLTDPLRVAFTNAFVIPTAWLPDVYVNPSNNGNLQSSKYKDIASSTPRGRDEFVEILRKQLAIARGKRVNKLSV